MVTEMEGNTIIQLANLLKPQQEDEEDEELDSVQPSPYANPGAIGPSFNKPVEGKREQMKEIWSPEDVPQGVEYDYKDSRPQPQYEMLFKQAVCTEDVFLGMGNKSPLTSACEELLVKISLPDTQFKDVDLIITDKFLDCKTPSYRLGLHLPHPVNSESCKAKWIASRNMLEVTLKLVREYDFVNQ